MQTLSTCSLVCSDWLPYATRCLFKNRKVLRISSFERLEHWAATLPESARLAPYIIAVEITLCQQGQMSTLETVSLMGSMFASLHSMDDVTVSLPNDISDDDVDQLLRLLPAPLTTRTSPIRSVKQLTVARAQMPVAHAILCLFPAIERLKVLEWYRMRPWSTVRDPPACAHNIRELVVSGGMSDKLTLSDLALLFPRGGVPRLVLDMSTMKYSKDKVTHVVADAVVGAVGSSATHFELHYGPDGTADDLPTGTQPSAALSRTSQIEA